MKNVFASRLLGGLVSVLLVVGCGVAPEAEEPTPAVESSAEGLTLERGPAGMQGTFSHDGSRIEFQSQAPSAESARLFVTVNGKRFDFEMDFAEGVLKSDGHEAVLRGQDRQALATFAFSLGTHLMQEGAPLRHELLVAVEAEYWSESPEGYVHRAKVMNADVRSMSNGNDGITCITKGRTYTSVYDRGTAGTITSKAVVANSNWGPNVCGGGDYNCMGRCGPGCGWGAPSAYTLDCLDHDTCSHDLCSADGAADANCGDEYSNAQDDWSLGVPRGCFG